MSQHSDDVRISNNDRVAEDSTGRVILWTVGLVALGYAFLYVLFWYIQPLFTGIYPQ